MNVELNIEPVNPGEACRKAEYDKGVCTGKSVSEMLVFQLFLLPVLHPQMFNFRIKMKIVQYELGLIIGLYHRMYLF